jgi:hypothetical protein
MWDHPGARAAHTNGRRSVLITGAQSREPRKWPQMPKPPLIDEDSRMIGKPGSKMIAVAIGLLFALGVGLLAVSFAAQFRYVDAQRHQHAASLIEAGALDVGMVIFALLALGLARAGLPAKTPRVLVVVCAAGSALMNYAAADVSSPRSVLAFVMPPLFLAVVVDQVAVAVRKHVLGIREGSSPWAAAGTAALWVLRVFLDYRTFPGLRRMVLNATPLPELDKQPEQPSITGGGGGGGAPRRRRRPRSASKTSRFITLVTERYGPLAQIRLDRVSPICSELAGEVELDEGAARTALRARVLAVQEQ